MSRMPKTLQILVIIGLLFLVGSVLGPLAEYVLPLALIVSLIVWPGPDSENPRLFKVMPWLWILSFLTAVALLVGSLMGKELLPEDARSPSLFELVTTILTLPPLLWSFIQRKRSFFFFMIASALLMGVVYAYDYLQGPRDVKANIDLVGGILVEGILTIYFWSKFKPSTSNDSQAEIARS